MKLKVLCALAAFGLFLTGCETEQSGGPGVVTSADKSRVIPPERTFSLDVPSLTTTLKQAESKTIDFKMDREKNFDQDVTVNFDGLPTGVTIEPPMFVIKPGDTGAQVNISAAPDAALGEFDVIATSQPASGAPATSKFKVKVEK